MPPRVTLPSQKATYFNEWEEYPARWLANLYPSAIVDKGDIRSVQPEDLMGYRRCHFFAGIGGWEYALSLAGWPEERKVWTGSCPCQPFSTAGKQTGFDDERHLWPDFFNLIRECKPPTVFGEQVAGELGLEWLARVRSDVESVGYAFGSANLPAASVRAPHLRARLFWVAHSSIPNESNSHYSTRSGEGSQEQYRGGSSDPWGVFEGIRDADGYRRRIEPGVYPLADGIPYRVEQLRAYGNAIVPQVAAVFIKSFLDTGR